jgi:hypothetical protein
MNERKNSQPDATRLAAAQLLDELAALAGRMAARLRSNDTLPALAVGKALVDVDKMQTRLSHHAERLKPAEGEA